MRVGFEKSTKEIPPCMPSLLFCNVDAYVPWGDFWKIFIHVSITV